MLGRADLPERRRRRSDTRFLPSTSISARQASLGESDHAVVSESGAVGGCGGARQEATRRCPKARGGGGLGSRFARVADAGGGRQRSRATAALPLACGPRRSLCPDLPASGGGRRGSGADACGPRSQGEVALLLLVRARGSLFHVEQGRRSRTQSCVAEVKLSADLPQEPPFHARKDGLSGVLRRALAASSPLPSPPDRWLCSPSVPVGRPQPVGPRGRLTGARLLPESGERDDPGGRPGVGVREDARVLLPDREGAADGGGFASPWQAYRPD